MEYVTPRGKFLASVRPCLRLAVAGKLSQYKLISGHLKLTFTILKLSCRGTYIADLFTPIRNVVSRTLTWKFRAQFNDLDTSYRGIVSH